VAFAWVFFRIDSFEQALQIIAGAWQINVNPSVSYDLYLTSEILFVLAVAVLLSVNGANKLLKLGVSTYFKKFTKTSERENAKALFRLLKTVFLFIVLIYALLTAAAGSYNPFIYFRF
jgi:alginate O-acetyltransferase complex protein AlgI